MCESPTVHRTEPVRSRTERRCDECFRMIPAGDVHEYVFGVWGGDATYYRTCAECVETRDELREAMEFDGSMYPEEIYCAIAYGSLRESFIDWCAESLR